MPRVRGRNNGAIRRLAQHRPTVHFPGGCGNEVETADHPTFAAGGPYRLLCRRSDGSTHQGLFRSGSSQRQVAAGALLRQALGRQAKLTARPDVMAAFSNRLMDRG